VARHGGDHGSIRSDLVNQEVDHQAALRIGIAVRVGQVKAQHGVEEMPLRLTKASPLFNAVLGGGIRNKTVMVAGGAERRFAIGWDCPVADVVDFIGAEANLMIRLRYQRPERVAGWIQRFH